MSVAENRPHFTETEAVVMAQKFYGLSVSARLLPSERDQNFHLTTGDNRSFVLKIASAAEARPVLDLQNKALLHLASHSALAVFPRLCLTSTGEEIARVYDTAGIPHFIRLLTHLPGAPLAQVTPHRPELLHSLGMALGEMDRALADFDHPAARRDLHWDLKRAGAVISDHLVYITDPARQSLVTHFLSYFEAEVAPRLVNLRQCIIHNDGNDYNILVETTGAGGQAVTGLIDFGDMLDTYVVCELAIAAAYIMLDKPDPIIDAAYVVNGYHTAYPLSEAELAVLYPLICLRLCTSVALSAYQQRQEPDNPYLSISERPAWVLLERLIKVDPEAARRVFEQACEAPPFSARSFRASTLDTAKILAARRKHLGPSLSVSYQEPLHIVRGWRQYLYDSSGRPYLDGVNNVCHVGHSHPYVVQAAQRQMTLLNTNTRYLHEHLVTYAERLAATLPAPLSVCFFVCSGSEANELALRLARTCTGRQDMIVVDGAYHGHTTALIEISPYKFNGPGGKGAPSYIHPVEMPDLYRGRYRAGDPAAGLKYAAEVRAVIERLAGAGCAPAGFICESLLSCGGQIVLPAGYLAEVYRQVRAAGGVCIADEVQVGFGRVGSHFWGFETQGVVPDIVTLGKPIGNGHPLAAVITTPEIAAAFNNGMEYFNTFGGNPVSCAVGLAVLDVIEAEKLQSQARQVGTYLLAELEKLKASHALIGDVRGLGLFLGIELVRDRETLEPAAEQASALVNRLKERGILLSTDGPWHNVIKFKPPLVFSRENADFLVAMLDENLANR